jgi:Kdo2-lipid IVA lauroyltransferase/acyltransferase
VERIGLALIWLLHFLPPGVLAPVGDALGLLLYVLARSRRQVVLTNLKLCFPHLDAAAHRSLARRHFRAFTRSLLDHGVLWWGSKSRIQRMVRIEGLEHWRAVAHRPVIWLAPHFVGLDMGGSRIITEWHAASMYSQQKDPVFDGILLHGRTRFIKPVLFARQDGVRAVVRTIREGIPFYYLPDMDLGARDSLFVPFFGVPAATVTGLSRLAELGRAVVVPAVTRQLPAGSGYTLRFFPAWENFPSGDPAADTRRMNAFIEERVREMPEQYYWLHKRFKTRPPGEPSPYA